MIVSFGPYVFDCQKLLLRKDGELLQLNEKPAQLLAFFIQNQDKILSKDDILSAVWPDRVVTDQVVFQNISLLRGLLGSDVIKTFSKKGYQWDQPFNYEPAQDISTPDASVPLQPFSSPTSRLNRPKLIAAIAVLLVITLTLIWGISPQSTLSETELAKTHKPATGPIVMIPFAGRFDGQLSEQISFHNETIMSALAAQHSGTAVASGELSSQDFFNSPFMVRKDITVREDQLVISGFVYPRSRGEGEAREQFYLLEYLIQGQYRMWQGYNYARSVPELTQQMLERIEYLSQSQYFSLAVDAVATAELSLMHSERPNDLDTLKHLIERLLEEDNIDVAGAHIERMLQLSELQAHPTYIAYANWLQGRLMLQLNQLPLAAQQLEAASRMMAKADMLSLQGEISKSLADVAFEQGNFEQAREQLFQAASQARIANRPVLEIRAYTLLSIFASKFGFDELKYEYLVHAKTLLADYSMDASHYMLPFYHFALFEKQPEDKIRKFRVVLEQPITPSNRWVFFSASDLLVDLYIQKEQWEEAHLVASNITEYARASSLYAKIHLAKGDNALALEQAQSAFNSARTQNIDWLGLEMALLLLEIHAATPTELNTISYRQYIQQTANRSWLQRNQQRLVNVGIDIDSDLGYAVNN